MKRRRRDIESASLSFLDVVSCGFGAVVLLLVITKTTAPDLSEDIQKSVEDVLAQLAALQIQVQARQDEVTMKEEELESEQRRLLLAQEIIEKKKKSAHQAEIASMAQNKIKGQLELALQDIDEEMKKLKLKSNPASTVGGIPADSRYIIFIIDTSGSMQQVWGRVQQELVAILDAYPKVAGIQIMNDMGGYMFSGYRGRWMPDSPARRKAIISFFPDWQTYSNSSPVEGIYEAIKSCGHKSSQISLYVFGDDFSGSVQGVIDQVENLNNQGGKSRVRIHGIGFRTGSPTLPSFSLLMKELTHRNNGTFIGLE